MTSNFLLKLCSKKLLLIEKLGAIFLSNSMAIIFVYFFSFKLSTKTPLPQQGSNIEQFFL
jgi:hypothetical protein